MAYHVPDDFSFLPTVDSTDEEILESQDRRSPRQQPPEAETSAPKNEAVADSEGTKQPVAAQDWPEEPAFPSAKLLPRKQPPAAPKAEAGTPLVSFRGAAMAKKNREPGDGLLPGRDDIAADKPKGGTKPRADKRPQPFIAPKPAPEQPLNPDEIKKRRWEKLAEKIGLRTLGMSVGVHVCLLLIAAFIGVSQVMDRQVDFLPGGSSAQSQAASEALTHKIQTKKNPWLKERPTQRKITVESITADIVLPEMPAMDMMDFSKINNRIDIGKAATLGTKQPMGMGGAGGGFGAGIGRGGKFSFLGQTALGRRVVFVVDVSGSMSQPLKGEGQKMTRFELMKKELIQAVKQIPLGTAYQVLYFSDFAWPHNEVDSRNGNALAKYRWEIKPEDYKSVKIPAFKYIQASPFTIQESVAIIQDSDNPGLTNWGAGLLMALNGNPKPDVIFFMTDGERQDEMGWIDIVTAENKRRPPMTVIHTSVMAQTDAAREMDSLARRNNGKFTVVLGEGKVIKGEDFFKMK